MLRYSMSQENSRGLTAPGRGTRNPRTFRGLLAPGYCGLRRRVLAAWLLPMAVVCSIAGGYRAAADDLDWSAWQRMPVSADGRLMPLDTFARDTVEAICGSVNPTFLPPDSAGTATLFPGGKPRTFSAPELLFSWLVEPEQWKGVAFLAAGDKELRTDVLDLPLADEQGRRLSFVTIAEAQNNRGLGQHWAELERQAQAAGQGFRPKGVEKRIKDLVDAYAKFDQLTFDPRTSEESSSRFFTRVRSGISAWQKLAGATQRSRAGATTTRSGSRWPKRAWRCRKWPPR